MFESAAKKTERSNKAVRYGPDSVPLKEGTTESPVRNVLIVEFRDEVYAALRSEFSGVVVNRAINGSSLVEKVFRSRPGLILINETLPDESGWLVSCKLNLTGKRHEVWLYKARAEPGDDVKSQMSGVDRVSYYDGNIWKLTASIRRQLNARSSFLPNDARCLHGRQLRLTDVGRFDEDQRRLTFENIRSRWYLASASRSASRSRPPWTQVFRVLEAISLVQERSTSALRCIAQS